MSERKESTRAGFGRGMLKVVGERQDVLVTAADTYRSFNMQEFVTKYPERYFEFGIAEQNMIAASAAMALEGYTVFTVGYSTFLSMRALEQIRTFVAYPRQNVKIVAGLAGLSGASCGVTHQGTEDIPIIRAIPEMCLVCPADAVAAEKMMPMIAADPKPYYIRLGRSATGIVYDQEQEFVIGKAIAVREYGKQFTLIAVGPCVPEAVAAAEILHKDGIDVTVLDMCTINPLDKKAVLHYAKLTGRILTVEDGNINGGLGSAVAEIITENGIQMNYFKRKGLSGFGTAGSLPQLLGFFGLDADSLAKEVRANISENPN